MKLITQRHANGCAVAALAMVAGISYQRSLKLLHPKRKPREDAATYPNQLFRVLRNLKIKHRILFGKHRLPELKADVHDIILAVRWPYGGLHAVIWDHTSQRILDPDATRTVRIDKGYVSRNLDFAIEIGE